MSRLDRDLSLKLRFKRLFWRMGYSCPLEVPVSHYEYSGGRRKRTDLTDIDVLGTRFDPALQPSRVMADCKSSDESHNRIFWLRGAMQYFGADTAYFVKTRISLRDRAIASRLGIATLDVNGLDRLEKQFDVGSSGLPLADPGVYAKQLSLLLAAGHAADDGRSKHVRDAQHFARYMYWYIPKERRILNLIEVSRNLAPHLRGDQTCDKYFVYHLGLLLSLALLEMGGAILARDVTDVPGQVRQYLFGGPMALADREKFLALLNEATGANERLEPDYFGELLELINRLVSFPRQASDVPRHMEALSFIHTLDVPVAVEAALEDDFSVETLKLAKDVLYLLVKVSGMSSSLIEELNTT